MLKHGSLLQKSHQWWELSSHYGFELALLGYSCEYVPIQREGRAGINYWMNDVFWTHNYCVMHMLLYIMYLQ